MRRTILSFAALAAITLGSSGCVGIYSNATMFRNEPDRGMSEADLIREYGTPAYAGFAENQKIYTYKVRDNKYIILVGIYEGHDLVVTCENGVVTQVSRVARPDSFTLFQPLPWAETE